MWILSGCDSALQQVLFMYEVGDGLGVGCPSFCRVLHTVGGAWLSLRHSQGKALQKELVSTLPRDLHFCLYLTKKKKKSCGAAGYPASDT